jgi:hypothetical protein
MSKGMDSKKSEKKKPTKTLKEKRAAKQEKKKSQSSHPVCACRANRLCLHSTSCQRRPVDALASSHWTRWQHTRLWRQRRSNARPGWNRQGSGLDRTQHTRPA